MNRSLTKKISVLFLCIVVFGAAQAQEKKGMEKILGEHKLPSITLNDMNGKQVNVADLGKTGKITVLDFWATWCVPCKKELNNINDIYDDWKKKYDVSVVAVSVDDSRSVSKIKPYADGQRWSYDILLDVNQDLYRKLGVLSVPFTLVLDQTGKIVYTHSGYTEGDENILEETIAALAKK
jgi:peroxiredoxin